MYISIDNTNIENIDKVVNDLSLSSYSTSNMMSVNNNIGTVIKVIILSKNIF